MHAENERERHPPMVARADDVTAMRAFSLSAIAYVCAERRFRGNGS